MSKIMKWEQFNEAVTEKEVQSEVQKEVKADVAKLPSGLKAEYNKFFHDKLKKFGAKGLGDLGDRRSEFFREIKSEWSKHKEAFLKAQE